VSTAALANQNKGALPYGNFVGWCWEREKIGWQEPCKFDCQLVQTIFIFCCPLSISPVVGKWLENQILIPDWTYFYCLGTTLATSYCPHDMVFLANEKS